MLLDKLFNRRLITIEGTTRNFVNVLDATERKKKSEELLNGTIKSIDFDKRKLIIMDSVTLALHALSFDDIVTVSRMRDGRIRIWINRGGLA